MGKTFKGKNKAARKIAAAKRKIERKTKGGKVSSVVAFALAAILTGCTTADSAQPAKSQTQENRFDRCIIIMAAKASVTNNIVNAEGDTAPALEMFTQTQSLESTGSTDSLNMANTQTPSLDVKPDVDVHWNDAIGAGGNAAATFLSSLTAESFATLRDYLCGRKSGSVTVAKKDGTTETLNCADGNCSYSGGTLTANDCADCTPK